MPVNKGDFLRLEYTAKIQETGEVFDTTNEKVAEAEGILSEKKTYGPLPIILGGGHVLKGLEDALIGMEEGEEKKVDLTPAEGFGERDPKLIQLIPMSEFRKQGIKPEVGMKITSEGVTGKIRNISGGRVRVDFNHELAGKNLQYTVKVEKIIQDDLEKVRSMIDLHYPNPKIDSSKHEIRIEDRKVIISMDEMTKFDNKPYMDITLSRFRISRDIWENMENVDKVEFVDVFEKKVQEKPEETSEKTPEELPEEETSGSTYKASETLEDVPEVAEEVLEEPVQEKKKE